MLVDIVEWLNFLPFFFGLPKRQLTHKIKVKDFKYLPNISMPEIKINGYVTSSLNDLHWLSYEVGR